MPRLHLPMPPSLQISLAALATPPIESAPRSVLGPPHGPGLVMVTPSFRAGKALDEATASIRIPGQFNSIDTSRLRYGYTGMPSPGTLCHFYAPGFIVFLLRETAKF